MRTCGHAIVPGKAGAKLARHARGAVVDPALYKGAVDDAPLDLFGDVWLQRQRGAHVGTVLTDPPQIRKDDWAGLRRTLERWRTAVEDTVVVLPIVPWWLGDGLPRLTEEVQRTRRPVALVIVDHFNGLDDIGAVGGMVGFIEAVAPLPVVLLRFDVSAIGGVAHGAYAGFVGTSSTRRHGPLPLKPARDGSKQDDRDQSPSVFVPALHDYLKASRLPTITRRTDDEILCCHDGHCRGQSLLRIARLAEVDVRKARAEAARHDMASMESLARTVFTAVEPRDAWWEHCRAGADAAASLTARGISPSPWLAQWLELGSPSHDPVPA